MKNKEPTAFKCEVCERWLRSSFGYQLLKDTILIADGQIGFCSKKCKKEWDKL